jgi:hypothetical protein
MVRLLLLLPQHLLLLLLLLPLQLMPQQRICCWLSARWCEDSSNSFPLHLRLTSPASMPIIGLTSRCLRGDGAVDAAALSADGEWSAVRLALHLY